MSAPQENVLPITRDVPKHSPEAQEYRVKNPSARTGRPRKWSEEILNEGYRLAKELRNMAQAAEITGVDYYAIRDWVRMKDRRANPARFAALRDSKRHKHSTALLRRLLARAKGIAEGRGIGFRQACGLATEGTGVSASYLYHLHHTGRLPEG